MMRLPSLWCWLALWVTMADVTRTTRSQPDGGGTANVHGTTSSDWACPLEKWSLEERQNRSQVVFTAVIESCQKCDSTDPVDDAICQRNLLQPTETADLNLALMVRIKKVVKGLDRPWEGRLVRVEGLKDPRICPSRVRLRDTRIFLASYVNQPSTDDLVDPTRLDHHQHDHQNIESATIAIIRLRLNSSLMAVSLRHLQQLRAFTKGSFSFIQTIYSAVSVSVEKITLLSLVSCLVSLVSRMLTQHDVRFGASKTRFLLLSTNSLSSLIEMGRTGDTGSVSCHGPTTTPPNRASFIRRRH